MTITFDEFMRVDMRVGTVVQVEDFPKARKPAFKVWIDFGALGIKKSSAQLTKRYTKESLLGKQVIAVVNFPPRQIADFNSEVLILGVMGDDNDVILLMPDHHAPNGLRIG